ncbi:putative flavin-containing monoamine oxidase C [Beauveria bassiana]|nr:putative flavin-containing monoamine oxidase C [Beauveria bassiana]KAH8718525.1 putative flavin-containing monoamine oxidase C [Beauveria bassiana]
MTQLAQDTLAKIPARAADVIVVGAGVSGLYAAYKLQQSGISCIVLEASGRVGGPTSTNNHYNSEKHPRTHALATEFSLLDESRPRQGKTVLEGFEPFEHHEQPAGILDTLSRQSNVCHAEMTVQELVSLYGATGTVKKLANMWTRTVFGLSSHNVSASQFLSHCASCGGLLTLLDNINGCGDDFAISESSQQIAAALAQRLSPGTIRLEQKVTHVERARGTTCRIYTETGDVFVGSKVALAGSLPMCGALQITPSIAMAAEWEAMRDEQGFSTSVDVIFDHPWWQQRGLSGYAQGLTGPISQVRPTEIEMDGLLHSLSCQLSGEQARGMWLWLMSEEERETFIIQHLDTIFGGDMPRAVQIIEKDENPLVSGQKSLNIAAAKKAGVDGDDVWARPQGNIHFAGADTSIMWKGHVEGALEAGERAASEILAVLDTLDAVEFAPRL